ncbi:DUF2075 domain-containing protein [Dietzia lutea]|uniref:AAA family ATPase n=1 Tax=Dietzia lutea TaxID=546160 RepID=A0A2S1R8F6_9ACTN|nr:DUF2075 domain-containing protein [Dietzia lutea]AWH92524.1 AAA family ATPase [Dietzia lutea]
MTSFRIDKLAFDADAVSVWADTDPRHKNWPVVYTLDGQSEIYIGESINGSGRLRQHIDSGKKQQLSHARVIIDDTFNKSACLDLESYLIRLAAGDGKYTILNRNDGITNADYYGRAEYQEKFELIFEALLSEGVFTRTVPEIENTDLFKLSPFKALNQEQAITVEDILSGLFHDLANGQSSRILIHGEPGTGKTVVAIYLMKLLADIQGTDETEPPEGDSLLSEFFAPGFPELLENFTIGLVIPQQSLRKSIQGVFKKTPGLSPLDVLTPFQVGQNETKYDLLIVDETHRLSQRANMPSAMKNIEYRKINEKLFGEDDPKYTQLDWINSQSNHQIYLLDSAQSVRTMDVSKASLDDLVKSIDVETRSYRLSSQMRVKSDQDYVGYVRRVLSNKQPAVERFDGYDVRLFENFGDLVAAIRTREEEVGLARLLAGYAWKWKSKNDKSAYDIEIGGLKFQWNQSDVDWVNSPNSINEVGSIHTIQGYDLNYAGVIIGPDLTYSPNSGEMTFNRTQFFDGKSIQRNKQRKFTNDELVSYIQNIYAVLLTRGMLGTYIYVCDSELRNYLAQYFELD